MKFESSHLSQKLKRFLWTAFLKIQMLGMILMSEIPPSTKMPKLYSRPGKKLKKRKKRQSLMKWEP